jgi:hypothetical protein
MDKECFSMFCCTCKTKLKRQVLGSNIFYYCRSCGCLSSEAYLAGETKVIRAPDSLSVHEVSSPTGPKLSEDPQKNVVEA